MLSWISDVFKKVLINLITLFVVGALVYYFILRKFLPFF
jgi:hypothetical protein